MPYKSEKIIKLEGTDKDRRIKLSVEQKNEIISLKNSISRNKCAQIYNVSKRTIDFLWYPEKLLKNKQLSQKRGGWRQYYNKDKHKQYTKNYRHYKQKIFLEEYSQITIFKTYY